jgi:four helix bundle protein
VLEYEIEIEGECIIVREKPGKYTINLQERLYDFSKDTIKMLMTLPNKKEFDVFRSQLVRSATSIGANYEESQASSYAEFRQRIQICLREARETHYWLRLLSDILKETTQNIKLDLLVQEIAEIKKIFGAISAKTKK